MMQDKNGREIRTGDIVRISNAFFKNANGLYYVEHSPGDVNWLGSDYSLHKVCRDGRLSTAKDKVAFWPLSSYCSDREKNALAHDWNRDHAEIEVVDTVDRSAVKAHFLDEAAGIAANLPALGFHWGKHSETYIRELLTRRHLLKVAESIT